MKKKQKLEKRGVLYVIVCASSSAPLVYKLIQEAQQVLWDVYSILTPRARNVVDSTLLAQLTVHRVRSEPPHLCDAEILPQADAIIVFPATIDLLQAWVLGESNPFAVALLSEYTGHKIPIVAVPCLKSGDELQTDPIFLSSVNRLKQLGVEVMYELPFSPKKQVSPQSMLGRLHRATTKES